MTHSPIWLTNLPPIALRCKAFRVNAAEVAAFRAFPQPIQERKSGASTIESSI
jgi:hypothetical protein